MQRLPRILPPLLAAAYVGVGVAVGFVAAGFDPTAWVGAALCIVAAASATAAAGLVDGARKIPVVGAGCLAAVACLPPPFQPLPVISAGAGALAAATGLHALWALLLPAEGGNERPPWLALPYIAAAVAASGALPYPEVVWAWPMLCGGAALAVALFRLYRATSLTQEATALRFVLTLMVAAGAAGAAVLIAPGMPTLAGAAAAVALAEGARRGAADATRGDTSFSPVEPITTVLVAALFGAVPFVVSGASTAQLSPVALGAGIFGALIVAPALGRRAMELHEALRARRHGPGLDEACDEAARATEEALALEEIAAGLTPVGAALPRGAVAITALATDRTAVLRGGEVEVQKGAGQGPALREVLLGRRRPLLAARIVGRSVREASLRPAADLVDDVGAELVVPLPCGEALSGVLLVGRPSRGRLRGRRADRLRRLASVLGPRVHAGILLEQGGRRIAELEQGATSLEDDAERLAHRAERLEEENRLLRADRAGTAPREIVGRSPAMRRVLTELRRAAAAPAAVLVLGEAGAGRALLARTLHDWSDRRQSPLVRFDCGALPGDKHGDTLRGSAEPAPGRPGLIELADGGCLVIEDVTALSGEGQAALLRALTSGEVYREGSRASRRVDIRLVAVTGKSAKEVLDDEGLEPELRDRLRAFQLEVPPLGERQGDVAELARFFLDKVTRRHGAGATGFTAEAIDALESFDWPGNVRQLRAVVEHAGLAARGRKVRLTDLPPPLAGPPADDGAISSAEEVEQPLDGTLAEVERRVFERALERAAGNKSEAARLLGLKRSTFVDRLRKHDL